MSADFLFGECGCCGGAGTAGEFQVVYALVPYPMGYISVGPGLAVQTVTAQDGNIYVIPPLCYLSYRQELTVNGVTAAQGTDIDIMGKATGYRTVSDTVWNTMFGNKGTLVSYGTGPGTDTTTVYQNGTIRNVLSNPYSLNDAAANAVKLLDVVQLLNPLATYRIYNYPGAQQITDFADFHFCYPSENVAFPGAQCTNIIYVSYPGIYDWWITSNIEFTLGKDHTTWGDFTGTVGAWNGFCPNALVSGPVVFAGVCVAKKVATRFPTGETRENSALYSAVTENYVGQPPAPVTIPPGENIYLPSDVPGFGWVSFNTLALPGL